MYYCMKLLDLMKHLNLKYLVITGIVNNLYFLNKSFFKTSIFLVLREKNINVSFMVTQITEEM